MKIGIGLSQDADGGAAARQAVRQAKRAVPKPDLAVVFGSIRHDQKKVHAALCEELDPRILMGGSSYAEITNAGVSKGGVAVLLLSLDGAQVDLVDAPVGRESSQMGDALARALPRPAASDSFPLGLLLSGVATDNFDVNASVRGLFSQLGRVPVFGGVCTGDYDLGMSHPDFWTNYQYCGERLTRDRARMALVSLPRRDYFLSFGYEHGWQPVGPAVKLTRCRGSKVYEIAGQPILDFYRQFLGGGQGDAFFEQMLQRYGFSMLVDGGRRTLVKVPIAHDLKDKSITYFPSEDLQDREVRLIQANRASLLQGAREAAERCREALAGRPPALVIVVSCCVRASILHSKTGNELDVIRGVLGWDVPVFGYYSGGEFGPCLSRYQDVVDPAQELAGSHHHGSTVCILAIACRGTNKSAVPAPRGAARKADKDAEIDRLKGLLAKSEEILDSNEGFLVNLSRKSYQDGEKLAKQNEIIFRYTPHDVFRAVGASVARGEYELVDSEFTGSFLFMDVKGFTSYSEEHRSSEVVRALNELFKPATEVIYKCGGDVDKFIGDCIFAAFREPESALKAGEELLRLFEGLGAQGSPFTVRIGINSGRAVRANVGSQDRREYTFIGDAVNLAQRLESNCAPGKLLICEALFDRAGSRFASAERREILVKGKKRPVVAYECSLKRD